MKYFKQYINEDKKFDKLTMLGILSALWTFSAIYGFVYEVIFYYFNGGMKDWYWRGGCFGPWIIIYAVGALVIFFTTYRFRKKPWAVFLISGIGAGTLEYLTGAGFYYLMDGKRNWDYNTEIMNFGNINGFVCLRSVLIFAISGIMLMYVIVPFLFFIVEKMNKKVFLIISLTVTAVYLIDLLYNGVVANVFPDLYNAKDLWGAIGFKFMHF